MKTQIPESLFCQHVNFAMNRRDFFSRFAMGLGGVALGNLLQGSSSAADPRNPFAGILDKPHFAPKAKRIIYLFMAGGPSQHDLFDYKPLLNKMNGEDLPASVRMGQRLTGMTGFQATLPLAGSIFKFGQHGQSGAWFSELLPRMAEIADDLCFIKSLYTEAINHDPAITFFQTGAQLAGRPSMGAWLSYGLGSANENLPAFVALISVGSGNPNDQPLYDRLWGSGFLPTRYQGVKFRSVGEPVLYLSNPPGQDDATRRRMLDDLARLNTMKQEETADPEIATRIEQYEMAYRMQTSVPELLDLSREPSRVVDMYGPDARTPGTYAYNCLLARRL